MGLREDKPNSNNHSRWSMFDKSKAAKDSAISRGFNDNYGYFLSFAGFYWSFPGGWIITALSLTNLTVHMFLFGYTAYIEFSNVEVMTSAVHFGLFMISNISEIVNGLFHRSEIEAMMRTLGSGVHNYGDTLDLGSASEIQDIVTSTKRRKKLVVPVYILSAMASCISLAVVGVLAKILMTNPDDATSLNDDNYDGINRQVMIPSWYPFDSRPPSMNLLCHFLQYLLTYSAMSSVYATDVIYISLSEEIVLQLRIVSITMRNSLVRAKKLMFETGDPDIRNSLRICVGSSVEHHNTCLRLAETLNDYYYFLSLVLMTGGGFLLCIAGVVFTSDEVTFTGKLTFFLILVAECVHLFVFCWYGEQIEDTSSSINQSIYNSDWTEYSEEMKPYLTMILTKGMKHLQLSAGGFMTLSMPTFANVLSSGYSYFNLLNASQKT